MISAVILAAGRSRRMGVQKLLLPLGGTPVITRVVDEVLEGPVDEVIVVVAEGEDAVPRALRGRKVRLAVNPDAEGDMLSSVRCGLGAIPEECAAALVVLGDQPGITREVVTALVEAFRPKDRGIAVPSFGGKRGHPLLFSMRYRDEILTRHDETGLRGLLLAHPDDVLDVEASTPAVLEDMDTPEDYRRAAARFPDRPLDRPAQSSG